MSRNVNVHPCSQVCAEQGWRFLGGSTPLLGTVVPRFLPYMAGATQGRSEDSLNSPSVFPVGEYRGSAVGEGVLNSSSVFCEAKYRGGGMQ